MNQIPDNSQILSSPPSGIRYGRELCDPVIARNREYLMIDGPLQTTSSFAGNTRRYHGLFINANQIILSAFHDEVNGIRMTPGWWGESYLGEGLGYTLGASLYPVVQEFGLPGVTVRRAFSLKAGFTATWEITGEASVRIRPLYTSRHVRDLIRDPAVESVPEPGGHFVEGCRVTASLPFVEDLQVYRNARYPVEEARGYDSCEDLWSPGYYEGIVSDSLVTYRIIPPAETGPERYPVNGSVDLLDRASRLCLHGNEIYAGYHWFTESWGRDTFISLPGLLLETGRMSLAEEVFTWHLDHRREGLILNRHPDSYHTSDATLWFFWALFQYIRMRPDSPFIRTIKPALEDLIMKYPESEVVRIDTHLLSVAPRSTWMDTPHTPREGKPIEINALWVLALELAEYLEIGSPEESREVRSSIQRFWNPEQECCYDLLDPDDPAIRPNQVIALSLGLLPFDEGRKVLKTIQQHLLTAYGLRTLSSADPGYHGRYAGDVSYHNGMVWPWFSGFFVEALMRYGESPASAGRFLLPLWEYFVTDGAGMLPELFDGDPPYAPGGTICQAWSIGEFIRGRALVLGQEGEGE